MVIGRLADGILGSTERLAGAVTGTVSEAFFEPVVRLGVTGLAGAGKTVFITALVHNMMNRARMGQMQAVAGDRIAAAYLQPQPDDMLPRFDFETHLAALTATAPHWPESTRAVSELRLSFRLRPGGFFGPLTGSRVVHLDIIDYPGEWLLDLALMERSYRAWADDTLARIDTRACAQGFMERARAVDPDGPHDEPLAQDLAARFTAYLHAARRQGYADVTPGRFLLPGDLEGSPVLTFAPIPWARPSKRGTILREMERRFDAYKARVVQPFFRDHFARIDRQVVLVDALDAIHHGPEAVEMLGRTMTEVLAAFRPGRNAWLSRLLMGRRVERILFAATKADHLHHSQHPRLTALVEALLRQSRDRADFAGARTAAMSIAALRATVEETRRQGSESFDCVRGRLLDDGRQAAFYPGELPEDPMRLLSPWREQGARDWLDSDYRIMRFAPAALRLRPGEGLPHIRLDRAAEFLFGDRLT
ncbi:MAG: YcjX family protein [Rhodobacteraceae bacterium]|nr:YcjX family protein [Paracoccaceae bacterium]